MTNEIKMDFAMKGIIKYGRDYTITYKNNKNVGTATMIVKGKGNYKG